MCEVLFTHLYLLLCNHHVIAPHGHVKDNQSPLSVRVFARCLAVREVDIACYI